MKKNPLPSLPRPVVPHLHRPLLVLLSILLWLAAMPVPGTDAQEQVELPSYWQYASSGRLHLVQPADINLDGVHEIPWSDPAAVNRALKSTGKKI